MKLWELAKKYYDLFEERKRGEEETYWAFKLDVIKARTNEYEEMSDLIYELKQEMDEDSAYKYVVYCLRWIIDNELETCDDIDEDAKHEEIDSLVDVYTGDLTEWLNKAPINVEWLTDAVREFEADEGDRILMSAQYLCIQRAFNAVIDFLCEKLGKVEIE